MIVRVKYLLINLKKRALSRIIKCDSIDSVE